ncbi:sarcosine oxidase [Pedobacter cryoconitis]|uniref:NAD(P)/FAD-dependent oxidoreductase n=1 Tax=Pedobacter cryoconitis TaxID=188932 RepID=UPI001611CA3F|nr:FAD-binding oxidoreductase [Pedobacter cryoconitis]MBB6270829.1 sarcosine oxidase [Pedobacter cryoconitis]
MDKFDIIVIGKGLVGSAAAKYLSFKNKKIAIIGPQEPLDYNKSIVFASHYDQARVQRLIGKDSVWTRLNLESVNQYQTIQEQSGIHFHDPTGCLYVNPTGEDSYLYQAASLASDFKLTCKPYPTGSAIVNDFSAYHFPESSKGLLEKSPAGLINPRLLLKAQLAVFDQHQGININDTILDITHHNHGYTVTSHEGNIYHASEILLAAGSFVNFFNLSAQKLDLKLKNEIILLARLNPEQTKELAKLPSLLYEIDNGTTEGIYLIKPVQYPDGNYYIKMGCNMPEDIYFDNIEQVQQWFRNGNSDQFINRLKQELLKILPDIEPLAYLTKRCIINRSIHGRPYIGETHQPGLYVASGCNGYSAMCSDAIGRVASHLLLNKKLPENYAVKDFEIFYQ